MVNHIVLWNFKPELSAEEKKAAGETIKKNLEEVKAQVEGVIALQVCINEMDSSNKDIALISSFESVDALNAYQVHPAHVAAAGFVRTVTCDRACFDYEA